MLLTVLNQTQTELFQLFDARSNIVFGRSVIDGAEPLNYAATK